MLNSLGSFFILGNLVLSDFGVMLGEILICLFKTMFSSSFGLFWLLIFGLWRLSVFLRDSRSVLWHVRLAWMFGCLPTFSVVTFVVTWFGNGCSLGFVWFVGKLGFVGFVGFVECSCEIGWA
jgi:hypothetical protein